MYIVSKVAPEEWPGYPQFVPFFREAIAHSGLANGCYDGAEKDFEEILSSPKAGLFIGTRDEFGVGHVYRGLSIVLLPSNRLHTQPMWAHLYCTGGRKLTDLLIEVSLDFMADNGYNTFQAINGVDIPEKTWVKTLFSNKRLSKPRCVGRLMEAGFT